MIEIPLCILLLAACFAVMRFASGKEIPHYDLPIEEQFKALERLEKDWDTYGSDPPGPIAIGHARKAVEAIQSRTGRKMYVGPVAGEEAVSIRFREHPQWLELSIEVDSDGDAIAIRDSGFGSPFIWGTDIEEAVEWMIEMIELPNFETHPHPESTPLTFKGSR